MPKFFSPDSDLRAGRIILDGANAEHLKVLRVREGETLTVCDGRGLDARCIVEHASPGSYSLLVDQVEPASGEPRVRAAVYAAVPKGDKAETIVQKCVELGADRVVFFASARCVSRPDGRAVRGKLERLSKIAEAAAMQSCRGRIPEVRWLPDFAAMAAEASRAELRAFLWEEAEGLSLRGLMREQGDFRTAALITGPEGGFSAEEAAQAGKAGIRAVTLGERILRCETAPLAALTAVMYECGELG